VGDGPLDAGTYRIGYTHPLRVTVTVPASWAAVGDWSVAGFKAHAYLAFYRVGNVYGDPCAWEGSLYQPSVGPTVDDLVGAMARFPDRSPTDPVAATVGGRPAKVVEWTIPTDIDISACDEGQYRSWTTSNWPETESGYRYDQVPGLTSRIHIVDVSGTRLVVDENWQPDVTDVQRAELDRIVQSITIDEP
jgi:hypothetical protein